MRVHKNSLVLVADQERQSCDWWCRTEDEKTWLIVSVLWETSWRKLGNHFHSDLLPSSCKMKIVSFLGLKTNIAIHLFACGYLSPDKASREYKHSRIRWNVILQKCLSGNTGYELSHIYRMLSGLYTNANHHWFIVEKVSCLLMDNENNTIIQIFIQEVGQGTHFSALPSYFFHGDISKL